MTAACGILLLSAVSCGPGKDSARWEDAEKTTKGQDAVSADAAKGEDLNKFFPKAEAPYSLIFKQEKTGFVMASLEKDGKSVASLSISDTANEPAARDKFKNATATLKGNPMAQSGSLGTAVLVDEFQLQVRSANPGLTKEEREAWLAKFDFDGLLAYQGKQ